MTELLLPRLSTPHAGARLLEVQDHLAAGLAPGLLASTSYHAAAPNATGGKPAEQKELSLWRDSVLMRMGDLGVAESEPNSFSARLGEALAEIVHPLQSDAAHDGVWSFLSLCLLPDVVAARWPLDESKQLPRDRWVGAQMGRDRNYLKVSWRRWQVLGELLVKGPVPLREDEIVQLTERTSLARNPRLVRVAARKILDHNEDGARMHFARELMKRVIWETGPRLLDFLEDSELVTVVDLAYEHVRGVALPRRAAT